MFHAIFSGVSELLRKLFRDDFCPLGYGRNGPVVKILGKFCFLFLIFFPNLIYLSKFVEKALELAFCRS